MYEFDYSAADVLAMLLGSFIVVFLLGLQSRNVIAGRYISAMVTSVGISGSQFIFVKYAYTGSLWVLLISSLGGCLGIASSIWVWKNIMEKGRK